MHAAVKGIASCLHNVYISSTNYKVIWGDISVLHAEMICMKDLWKKGKWKYFINLTGQEFPLKTNKELVRILQVYNGSNDIGGEVIR